ncbi:protease inhibitor I42 family protein [Legionella worsleiensis]|uniref:Secreted protein n=1 Tax=Legionella worsleiensis TaxID=45076 RepID=A0A0W1AKZ7_9GAMM|nr:protease inhibitor I42 family protein [Legionella worsleiensis]KTD81993.1 secreted protein [Legionella worsleiensis]STY30375.1 secreted protein [Legionella worsleiensis]
MKLFLGGMLMVFSMMVYAVDDIMLQVPNNQPSFKVSLAANPTTGYQWTVEQYDKTLFKLTSSQFQRPKSNLIGAGGQMLFTFTLNKGKSYPKSTKLVFQYARAWEKEPGKIQTVNVNFINPQ